MKRIISIILATTALLSCLNEDKEEKFTLEELKILYHEFHEPEVAKEICLRMGNEKIDEISNSDFYKDLLDYCLAAYKSFPENRDIVFLIGLSYYNLALDGRYEYIVPAVHYIVKSGHKEFIEGFINNDVKVIVLADLYIGIWSSLAKYLKENKTALALNVVAKVHRKLVNFINQNLQNVSPINSNLVKLSIDLNEITERIDEHLWNIINLINSSYYTFSYAEFVKLSEEITTEVNEFRDSIQNLINLINVYKKLRKMEFTSFADSSATSDVYRTIEILEKKKNTLREELLRELKNIYKRE